MEEIDYMFSRLTEETDFHEIKDNFNELGIDIFRKTKSGEIKIKSLNELFQELSDKREEL